MNAKNFNHLLFSEKHKVYAVLDGASVPDLPTKLYEMRPQHICLYRGELEPDIAEVAPYLVRMVPETEFSNWVINEGWGKHWGIFAQTQFSIYEVRKHFRAFLTVHDEEGNPMLFRYYDPRVLRKFLPTCNADELGVFFKTVTNYFLEDENPATVLNYSLQNGELKLIPEIVE